MTNKPKTWPAGVEFVADYVWDVKGGANKQSTKLTGSASKNVRIQQITDQQHPAHGEGGLFAAQKLPSRSRVLDYVGVVRSTEHESKTSDYILGFTEGLSIDAEQCGNEARFINDFRNTGRKANVQFDLYKTPNGETRMGVFVLSKDIRKGEELLVTYGKGFWEARLGTKDDWADYEPPQFTDDVEPE
eukprot:TRINITY_DN113739_c0_g1_i1.p1 TRINITY_DN113739_c0_g1~~TRINITY_DN113739_c0_g1_i1.p1  ORF type:complete len:188 (+),score=6.11 TRINITY_DN113739_c0_g1_i1:27-590(+)